MYSNDQRLKSINYPNRTCVFRFFLCNKFRILHIFTALWVLFASNSFVFHLKIICATYKRLCGVRSRCRRFLNQFDTWVNVRPVFFASIFFSSGVGYLLWSRKFKITYRKIIKYFCWNNPLVPVPVARHLQYRRIGHTYFGHSNLLTHFDFSLWSNTPFLRHPIWFSAADIFFVCDIYRLLLIFGHALFPPLCSAPWTIAIVIRYETSRQNNAILATDTDHDKVHDGRQQLLWLCDVHEKKKKNRKCTMKMRNQCGNRLPNLPQNAFVRSDEIGGGQTPQERRQFLNIAFLLQRFAQTLDMVRTEIQLLSPQVHIYDTISMSTSGWTIRRHSIWLRTILIFTICNWIHWMMV